MDSNIYLGQLAAGAETKSALTKFEDLVRRGAIRLYIPAQVVSEFERNRESVIKRSIDDIRDKLTLKAIPSIATWFTTTSSINVLRAQLASQVNELCEKITRLAKARKLPGDRWFSNLVGLAGTIDPSDGARQRSLERAALKNPPGKNEEVCDRLIWESVLESVPWLEELHVISDDPDYRSPLNPDALHGYLAEEWTRKNFEDAYLYRSLAAFLDAIEQNEVYSRGISTRIAIHDNVRVLEDAKMEDDDLEAAASALLPYVGFFEVKDASRVVAAAVKNPRLLWLRTEGCCSDLYRAVLSRHAKHLPAAETDGLVIDFPEIMEWRQERRSGLRVVAS